MAIKNKTRYAILGILSIAPGSGYDIKKYCDTVISNVWNENYGHIYPVLRAMLGDGLIEYKEESLPARKKVYSITEKGRKKFMDWLIVPAQYLPVRSEFMLKFLFSSTLPTTDTMDMLNNYKKRHEVKLTELQSIRKYLEQEPKEIQSGRNLYLRSTLRYGILSTEASIRWCDEIMHDMADF
ncbi:MAG: PadR family transcriptional regulator [Saccharofermentanales bacterium]